MRGRAPFNRLAQGVRQAVPGFVHIGKQGIAALGGQLLGMQHRAQAWQFFIRQVRVPEFTRIAQADGLTVLNDVGDDKNFRVTGQQKLLEHMDLQDAEATAEVDLLLRGNALVTKHQNVMFQMSAMDTRKVLVTDRQRQIQTDDLGSHGAVERADVEGLRGDAQGNRRGRRCRHKSLPRRARPMAR